MKAKIGALWYRKNQKTGSSFYSGSIEIYGRKIKVVVSGNNYKTDSKHPDLVIFDDDDINSSSVPSPAGFISSDGLDVVEKDLSPDENIQSDLSLDSQTYQ